MELDEMLAVMAASIYGGLLASKADTPPPEVAHKMRNWARGEAILLWQDILARKQS